MKVGDLVSYVNRDYGIGIIIRRFEPHVRGNGALCTVLWSNGVRSNHSSKQLVWLSEE